nr:GPN-loop GTPase 3 [Ipomoea batatas]
MPWGCSGNVVLLDWIKDRFDSLTKSELAHFITICWGIWNSRNQKVWNNVDSSPKLVVKHSLSYLKEWKSVRSSPHLQDVSTQRSTDKWVKLDSGTLKLNIDASTHQNAFQVGMGWILRDHQGYFVAAQAATRPGPLHPREAEALAVRKALSWLKDNQWEDVVVETDAGILVHHLHKPSFSPFGLLIADIASLLSTLKDVKLCHVRRDANVVAHLLASYAFSHFARETWLAISGWFLVCNICSLQFCFWAWYHSFSSDTIFHFSKDIRLRIMGYAQLVIGPAGSGKSTYCSNLHRHCEATRRTIHIVNLDPAAENFDYPVAMDIRELISLDDVMEELHLGPNGGLIYCMEHLEENLDDWLTEELDNYMDDDYLVFDCPGQIELFSHVPVLKNFVEHLKRKNFNVCVVYLLDSQFITDVTKFISGCMASLSAMVQLELPHVNILSKMDLVTNKKDIDNYLNPEPQLLLADLNQRMAPQFQKLNKSLIELVDQYSMVSFMPLDLRKESSIQYILSQIDNCIQYGEDADVKVKDFDAEEDD